MSGEIVESAISIGALARATGVKVPTIRYYEAIALLPAPSRSASNRRLYIARDAARLSFIRRARELGFELAAIRTLIALQDRPEQSCSEADSIVGARLTEVNEKITHLSALKTELERMLEGCGHGRIASCHVIEVLADHGECQHQRPPSPRKKS
ncbi:MAG TPA: helix-turn-helix domain-containing protein [Methylovirgula sp.]